MVGLAVSSDELRAVAVRDGVARWAASATRAPSQSLGAQITELLRFAPVPRWRHATVVAAVGPSAAQLKRLSGLPPLADIGALEALVRENAGRFFLRNGIPLEISGIRMVAEGVAWAAAFDRPVVREIETGCRSARMRLRAIVPAVAVLLPGTRDGRVVWRDGPFTAEITVREGALYTVRRSAVEHSAPATPPPPPIQGIGADAWRFADAWGATFTDRAERLAFRPEGERPGQVPRHRLIAALTAAGITALFAGFASGSVNSLLARRASERLFRLQPSIRAAAATEDDLRRMSHALAEVEAFAASRRSSTRLLAQLAAALPEGASLVDIHVDGERGSLVLLAPRAARAAAALDQIAGIADPELIGPVTREIIGGREFERASVRFALVVEHSR